MNSWGRIFRASIFGESHGPFVGITIDGVPPGLSIEESDFVTDLERRKGGKKGTTPRKEEDLPRLISGVFEGRATGAPLTILFANERARSADYEAQRDIPRPGHADFVAHHKFSGFEDYRGGGHFSGRLTVALVAAGTIAKKILGACKVDAFVEQVGGEDDIEKGLQKAIEAKDSVGGIVKCQVTGVPIGWGEPFWDSVESVLAHALFAIPAVKGVEFGAGFRAATMLGSEHNDALLDGTGTTITNHAGGIVGGISNGNPIEFRVAIKPTSSTPKPQRSYNWTTGERESFSIKGRHDLCIALRVPVIVEAVTAMVLADFHLLNAQKQVWALKDQGRQEP